MSGEDGKVFRIFTILFITLTIIVSVIFSIKIYESLQEKNQLELAVEDMSSSIDKLKREKSYHEEYYNRLMKDEVFAERIIRETLGYSSGNEIVFRFDDKFFSEKDKTAVRVNHINTEKK